MKLRFCLVSVLLLACWNNSFAFQIVPGQVFEYRTFAHNQTATESIVYSAITSGSKTLLRYTNTGTNINPDLAPGRAAFICRVTADEKGIPFETSYAVSANAVRTLFNQGEVNLVANWKGKSFTHRRQFSAEVSTEPFLMLRTMDLATANRRVFDFVSYRDFPGFSSYPMVFEVLNRETVTVPAGTFICKKAVFTANDWRSIFFKAYYDITDDDRRWIVKIEFRPFGGGMELLGVR